MRIAFYTEPKWAFGSIHSALCDRLPKYGIFAAIIDYTVEYETNHLRKRLLDDDIVVTDPGASIALTDHYGIPREKIVLVSHGEPDLHALIDRHGRKVFSEYRDFAVVSESLYASCLSIGIRQPSCVLRLGVNCGTYDCDVPPNLNRVGFGATLARNNAFGVEIKRGHLVQKCAEQAGLEFFPSTLYSPHQKWLSFTDMPAYYRSVDAVIMSSLQEGAGLPPLEAAASGRLVIGTPCGHFPRLAYNGGGILAPLSDDAFVDFVTAALKFYKTNPQHFRQKCRSIKEAAQSFDWRYFEKDWVEFFQVVHNRPHRCA